MGSYREQLLKETYGTGNRKTYEQESERSVSESMIFFKLKFIACIFLFIGFLWLCRTGGSIMDMNAEQIVHMIAEDQITDKMENLGF